MAGPELVHTREYAGFQKALSLTLRVNTPAPSLFTAAARGGGPGDYHIYQTTRDLDVDISNAGFDFDIIEEVRYRDLSENRATVTKHDTVTVSERAITDINRAYLPRGPHII